jgi:hypothetical protein
MAQTDIPRLGTESGDKTCLERNVENWGTSPTSIGLATLAQRSSLSFSRCIQIQTTRNFRISFHKFPQTVKVGGTIRWGDQVCPKQLWCSHTGHHPQEELAKFDYKSERKVEIFKNPTIVLQPAGTCCQNIVIWESFPLNLATLVHFFHKMPSH